MKTNKVILVLVLGVVLGFIIGISPGVRRILDSSKEKQEREQRHAEEDRIRNQFDADFSFVCDRIVQRDLEIYSLAEKRDRELLADVERLSLPTNNVNEYRVKLETRLKQRINRHIEECVRFRSRIREWRSGASARWLWADIYQTKCDCECCKNYTRAYLHHLFRQ